MFSGIVESLGRVAALRAPRGGDHPARLEIDAAALLDDLASGASVAVNGACLTLVGRAGGAAAFDVVPETLRRTNLGGLRAGDAVNLERSLRVGDRVDGHFVQGHVDGIGTITAIDARGADHVLHVAVAPSLSSYIVPKGSISLDGVSLTVVDAAEGRFSVALIPATLERTTLGRARVGDRLNVETDLLARLVVQRLVALVAARGGEGGVTLERLRAIGFAP